VAVSHTKQKGVIKMAVFEKITANVTSVTKLGKALPKDLTKEQEGILRKVAQKKVKAFRKVTDKQKASTIKMVVETIGKQGGAPCTTKQLRTIALDVGLTDKSVARTIAEAEFLHPVGCNRKNTPWRCATPTLKARAAKFSVALPADYRKVAKISK